MLKYLLKILIKRFLCSFVSLFLCSNCTVFAFQFLCTFVQSLYFSSFVPLFLCISVCIESKSNSKYWKWPLCSTKHSITILFKFSEHVNVSTSFANESTFFKTRIFTPYVYHFYKLHLVYIYSIVCNFDDNNNMWNHNKHVYICTGDRTTFSRGRMVQGDKNLKKSLKLPFHFWCRRKCSKQ